LLSASVSQVLRRHGIKRRRADMACVGHFPNPLTAVAYGSFFSRIGGGRPKQLNEEGASSGLILSLLFDHCLLLHPEQTARLKNQLPAYTVGSLQRKSQMDVLLAFIKRALEHPAPAGMLSGLAKMNGDVFKLMPSEKHLSGRLGAHGV